MYFLDFFSYHTYIKSSTEKNISGGVLVALQLWIDQTLDGAVFLRVLSLAGSHRKAPAQVISVA